VHQPLGVTPKETSNHLQRNIRPRQQKLTGLLIVIEEKSAHSKMLLASLLFGEIKQPTTKCCCGHCLQRKIHLEPQNVVVVLLVCKEKSVKNHKMLLWLLFANKTQSNHNKMLLLWFD
jgi:hypothetical protein